MILTLKFKVRKKFTNHSARKKQTQQTLYAHISPKSQATEVIIFLNDYDEAEEESDDDSLSIYPSEIVKTPALRKSKYWQFPTSQQLTVAPLAHRWQR